MTVAVSLISQKAMNTVVSHLDGVRGAVYKEAVSIADVAQGHLEMHRYYGDDSESEIEVDRGTVDSFVSLVDEAAMSIEFGSRRKNGRFVPGLYIVTGAAGIAK